MNKERRLVLIIHNVRSAHNVGAMFRTADGAGVERIYLTGYTPLPPRRQAISMTPAEKAFIKTALGAEDFVPWKRVVSPGKAIAILKKEGFEIVMLEQDQRSINYRKYKPKKSVALLVGNEVRGVDPKILALSDCIIELPMAGKKNSLNVSVAAGIALYQIQSTMRK